MITKPMVACAATLLAIVAILTFEQGSGDDEPGATVYSTTDSRNQIFADGVVEGSSRTVELHAEVAGRVLEVSVREGDRVSQGQALCRLDDREQLARVALAQTEIELAEAAMLKLKNGARDTERLEARLAYEAKLAEWERADLAWRRTESLRAQKAVSQETVDEARTTAAALRATAEAARARANQLEAQPRADDVAMAQAEINAAKARFQLAQVMLERTTITAPCDGTILSVDVSPGEIVTPESTEAIVRLANTRLARVRAYVEELDAPHVRPGMEACVKVDGFPDRIYRGTVLSASPEMSGKVLTTNAPTERTDTKMREIVIELDDASDLIIGLRVDVFLTSPSRKELQDDGVPSAKRLIRSSLSQRDRP